MAFAETFKALSDPVRREILQLLKNGKMSAGEIGGHFNMTGATISYHLKILKKADLVWETKVKNFVYYELNTTVVEELLLWLSDLKGGKNEKSKEKLLVSRRNSAVVGILFSGRCSGFESYESSFSFESRNRRSCIIGLCY